MKIAILLFGQLRSIEKVWEYNKKLLEGLDYDVYIHTTNEDTYSGKLVRRTKEEVFKLFENAFGNKMVMGHTAHDDSLFLNGGWEDFCSERGVDLKMFDTGMNAYYPNHEFPLETSLTNEEMWVFNKSIQPSHKTHFVYWHLPRYYTMPFSGREMQFLRRDKLYDRFNHEKKFRRSGVNYDLMIITRPDFVFEPNIVQFFKDVDVSGKVVYAYPLEEYLFTDVFAVCNPEVGKVYCKMWKELREYAVKDVRGLFENLKVKTSNLNSCENLLSYHLRRNGIQIKYISDNTRMFLSNLVR